MAKLSVTLCDASGNELEMIFSPDYHYEHDKSNPLILIELLNSKDEKFNNVYDLKEEDIRDLIAYLQSVLSNFQQIDFSRYQPTNFQQIDFRRYQPK